MNNDYKWETIGRCKFYTDGTTCTDIEVMDDAKEISFIYPKIMINRERCQKVFSSVEIMLIGRNVISIAIPNKMFPNIKHVESKSNSFINGKYLIERAGGKLLNVFGQSEDAEIDFTLFNRIGSYAFEGCRATKVSDSEDTGFIRINNNAFFGSGFMNQPFVNGIKCVGSLVVDVDETADEVIMPKTGIQYFPDKFVKCMRLPNIRCLDEVTKKPRKVIIEDKNISHDNEVLFRLHEPGIEEFESRIPRYKTVDGILYSADMKTLVLCPKEKTGEVIIPDGVTRIRRQAFCLTKISRVVFPDSLVRIEDEAFYQCKNLKEIDFGNGIEQLGADGKQLIFSGCAFERLVFPSQIKEIGVSAFYACHKLKEIVFNEGLEKIAIGAFKSCMMLREVNLPASIRELGKSAFVCIPNNRPYGDLHINMTTIPDNLVKALVYYGSLKTLRCIYVHIDNANGVYDFVLPDSITSIRNGYSKIALDFNMLANTEYIHNTKRLETAFHYAASSRYECIVAYKTYLKTKHKAAKEFLEKEQYRVAAAIIEELDEKDFVDFVKLRCINLEYDSCIMKRLQEKNWNIALAYMLEGKTGEVTIPDGVERIRKQAFFGSKISKVVFPDSLVRLQNEAFYGCENLKEIDFGNGIEQIGGAENKHIFSGCPVEKLIFPPQVKEIGISAFYSCGELKEIIFEEGLKYIREGAFKNCPKLTEVNLPESIKNVGLDAFVCEIAREKIQDININLTTIPKGLGRAIIHPGSMQTPRCVNVHVHNKNETFDFVIPDCVSATTNGYSEIVTGFNLMASDPEYFKKFHHLKWLNTAFMYAANSRFKYVCAYKTYKRTKNELAKEYLIDYQKMAADAIALELAEKDFVDFLRLEFINLGYDEDIVKCLEEQNWNVALAYMLNEEKEKDSTGNTFVI